MLVEIAQNKLNTQAQGVIIVSTVYRNNGPKGTYKIPGTDLEFMLYNGESVAIDKRMELN